MNLESSPSVVLSEFLQAVNQFLTRNLILSTNMESATACVKGDGDWKLWIQGKRFPVWYFAADSCALDRYDIPVQRERNHQMCVP